MTDREYREAVDALSEEHRIKLYEIEKARCITLAKEKGIIIGSKIKDHYHYGQVNGLKVATHGMSVQPVYRCIRLKKNGEMFKNKEELWIYHMNIKEVVG